MKKAVSLILVCVLLLAALCGCGSAQQAAAQPAEQQPAAQQPAEQQPAAAEAPADSAATFEERTFTIATCYTDVEIGSAYLKWFAEYVTEHTNGAAQFDIYTGGTLAASNEEVFLVMEGGADFTAPRHFEYESIMPFYNMLTCCHGGALDAVEYMNYLTYEDPVASALIKAECDKNGYVMLGNHMPAGIDVWVSTKPFTTIDDFKDGQSVFGGSKAFFDILNITHTNLTPGDGYEALQRGVIDGFEMNINAVTALKWFEVAKYMACDGTAGAASPILCNIDTWNSLSPEYQQVMRDGQNYASEKAIERATNDEANQLQMLKDNGVTLVELPEEDMEEFFHAYFISDVIGARQRAAEQGVSEDMEKMIAAVAAYNGYEVPET